MSVSKIPKRLIHVWGTPSGSSERLPASVELPLACQAAAVNATLLHPDYEYRFFDDAAITEFLENEPREHQDAYARFPFAIQRFDFFRYLAVYRLGGFYFDLDVYLARRIDCLRHHACVFPFEELTISEYLRDRHQWDWEIGNFAFGAEPGHPFIAAVIRNCIRGLEDPEWALETYRNVPRPFRRQFVAPHTTGPALVTRTLAEETRLRPLVTVLFPNDVCDAATWHRFGDYGAHLMMASWRSSDGFVRQRLARVWETRTRRRQLFDSLGRGARREGAWGSSFPDSTSERQSTVGEAVASTQAHPFSLASNDDHR